MQAFITYLSTFEFIASSQRFPQRFPGYHIYIDFQAVYVLILIYVLNNAGQDLGVPNLKQRPPIAKLSNYISTFATGQHKPVRPLVCVLYRPCTLNCITLATSKTSSTISTMCNINMHKLFGNISMCNIHIYVQARDGARHSLVYVCSQLCSDICIIVDNC